MFVLPPAARPLFDRFSVAFSEPTFERFVLLAVGAILTSGRRTTTAILWAVRCLIDGHPSSYHRVFSRSPWVLLTLGRVLAAAIMEHVPDDGRPVECSVDDTTARHKGKCVYGKGRHRDAVRSTHSHMVWVYGHKWVVLAIHLKLPFARRAWALPVLVSLYRSVELDKKEGRRHSTPIDLAKRMMLQLMRWFPGRKFVLLGDGGYASHDMARFVHRHRRRLTLVSLFHPDANLFEQPAERRKGQVGRPRVKGKKMPSPEQVVAKSRHKNTTVDWYGGGKRKIEYVTGMGHWHKSGHGLVTVRWVYVKDKTGTHRDQYFYTTDPTLKPEQIVGLYTARWSIEVTFEEIRAHLGFETTKQHCRNSVLRTAPCLLGLFSVVTLIYIEIVKGKTPAIHPTPAYDKTEPTFSDAMFAVRRVFWEQTILKHPALAPVVPKLPGKISGYLLDQLAAAA